jgi:outer membrane immunogenic protein
MAADLAARPYTKAPMAVEPVYNWSGFYVGANAGYGWARDEHADMFPGGGFWTQNGNVPGGVQTIKPEGAVFGGQVGYNWQVANWVFGLEGQFNATNIKRTDISIFFPDTDRLSANVDQYGTATGRVGYAFNNWLPYVKGGYAAAHLKTTNFDVGPFSGDHTDLSSWRNGFVVGAGLEYAFAGNWIIGIEYDYMDFGSKTQVGTLVRNSTIVGRFPDTFRDDLRISTVTGRLSYKFGGPVAARY